MKKMLMLAMMVFGAAAFAAPQGMQMATKSSPLLNRNLSRQHGRPGTAEAQSADGRSQPPATRPVGPMPNVTPPGGAAAANGAEEEDEKLSIEFNQTPIDLVYKVYGDLVKKTILKDPGAPQPSITLLPKKGQELTNEDKVHAIETVLEMNGVHLEPYGEKFVRAIARGKVRKDGVPLYMDGEMELSDESNRVISMMIVFKNIGTEEAQKALEGFKSDSGTLQVFERTNGILVTDTEMNVKRMREIARAIDIATPILETVETIQIKYANANEIKTVLEAIVTESQKDQEKAGKNANNNIAQSSPPPRPFGSTLLNGRLGRNQPQPEQVKNETLVTSVSDADRGMIRGKVLIVADERSNKLLIVTQKANMDFFKKVIADLDVETTPDTAVKVYRLKYADAEEVADMINDLIGNASSSKSSGKNNQNANARNGSGSNLSRGASAPKKSVNQRSGEAKAGELSKDNTTVLADKRINGLVVMTDKELVPTLESIIQSMDVKLAQVLIETAIIEVTLGKNLNTGVDWVQNAWTGKDPTVRMGGGGGSGTSLLAGMSSEKSYTEWYDEAKNALGSTASLSDINSWIEKAKESSSSGSPIGSGITTLFKSDKLNLSAVISAAKTDAHSKYIASPIVMTVDNKEATINATDMTYLLKGFTSSGNSYSTIAVPDYEQKELGIEIKTTPKINPNGTVMLEVETKYTQKGAEQTIKYSAGNTTSGSSSLQDVSVPTTSTREMSADVILENMQTVVLGGLTDTYTSESETGIPILKDIPWIGKWLFGKVTQDETRKELLIFMTPYVLDDGEAAQVEASRRKNVLSDSRPWDDRGWSLSELADPVSKKEQLRRIKAEWKKQDEERRTKLAIESEKVKRMKDLENMSKEERDFWIEQHKEEIEKEQREALEAKMLDDRSQGELRKLAAEIRARKLREAEVEIRKADDEARQENERGRMEAEKREDAAKPAEPDREPSILEKLADEVRVE